MLKLRDIMTRNVLTVSPDMSVREAMERLVSRHVSGAPVADGDGLIGVVSSTDLLADVATTPSDLIAEHTVAEVMTAAPLCTMPPDTPVTMAADIMRHADVHRVLVTDGTALLGIVTTSDIARAVAERKLSSRTYVFGAEGVFDERGWERDG